MKTKFSLISFLLPVMSCVLLILIITVLPMFFNDPYYDDELFPKIFLPLITTFTFIYILFGEMRTKNIILEFGKEEIKVKRFYGLKSETYDYSDFKGWKFSFLSSNAGTHEYLYLLNDSDKKVIKISEFYHKNYFQVKDYIKLHFKDLGFEKFSFRDELKEIFI